MVECGSLTVEGSADGGNGEPSDGLNRQRLLLVGAAAVGGLILLQDKNKNG